MNFIKSQNLDAVCYHVSSEGKLVGKVKRVERWVVRGTRIEWEAYRSGKYLGSFGTRNEAGAVLAAA